MKSKIISILVLVIVVVSVGFLIVSRERPSSETPRAKVTSGDVNTKKWETRVDDQLPVTVEVTPIEFGKNVGVWKFAVVFDSHSVSLDDDPLKVATLFDDEGNSYQPTDWEGPGPGGHHREGVLVFEAINPAPPYVELKIKDVGGIPERSFKWNTE